MRRFKDIRKRDWAFKIFLMVPMGLFAYFCTNWLTIYFTIAVGVFYNFPDRAFSREILPFTIIFLFMVLLVIYHIFLIVKLGDIHG